jgi:integrase
VSLAHFKRIVRPARVFGLCTAHVDDFIAARRKEPGLRPGTLLSPATVNKDLRHVKAALGLAEEWGYLPRVPRFRMERAGQKLPAYVTPEHFAALYAACDTAVRPEGLPYPAGQWWRSLLMTGLMTGWRIGSLLALRRDDVDLEAGTARSRFGDNKGRRDQLIALHPAVVEHLRLVPSFEAVFFPWPHGHRQLYEGLQAIQQAAGVKPPFDKPFYGFHDLRRAFATLNADRLTPDALQALMQHKDYQTTQRYINMARQLRPAVDNLFVPKLPPPKQGQG